LPCRPRQAGQSKLHTAHLLPLQLHQQAQLGRLLLRVASGRHDARHAWSQRAELLYPLEWHLASKRPRIDGLSLGGRLTLQQPSASPLSASKFLVVPQGWSKSM
jgi:hypothetical protein